MEELSESEPRTASRLGEANAFYKSMADELTTLSKRTAELSWAMDVAPRSHRSQNIAKTPAPTGRLPAARTARTQSAHSRPQERSSTSATRLLSVGTRKPSVVRERPSTPYVSSPPAPPAVSVEASARKPIHLQEVKTRPVVVSSTRRGAQPRSQTGSQMKGHGNGGNTVARARRLRLSEARTPAVKVSALTQLDDVSAGSEDVEQFVEKAVGSPLSLAASRDNAASRLASPKSSGIENLLQLRPSSPGAASIRSSTSLRTSRQFPQPSAAMRLGEATNTHVSALEDLDASATSFLYPNPIERIFPEVSNAQIRPEPVKARLASVTDLQLVLPEMVTSQLQSITACTSNKVQLDGKPVDEVATSSTPPPQRPPPMVRPVIRGLIADVIDEMRGPEFQPAEVVGGVEITPSTDPWKLRRPVVPAIDEDIFGRRVGIPPPAYEDLAPPPYESQQPPQRRVEDALSRAQAQIQTQIQTQLQMISLSQAQLQDQRNEVSSLTHLVQQQADAAQHRMAQSVEQQTSLLQAVLQRGLAEVQRDTAQAEQQMAFTLQQAVSAAIVAASQQHPPSQPTLPFAAPPAPPPPSHLDGQILPVLLDTLRNLQGNFQQQIEQVMRVQSEERAAHMSALRALQQTPRTVQAVVPLTPVLPPREVTPPPTTTEVGAQVSLEESVASVADGEAQVCLGPSEDHEVRVARFTDYLLHGPAGHREPALGGLARPLTPWPLPSDLVEIDTMLAEALGGPVRTVVVSETSDTPSQEQTSVDTSGLSSATRTSTSEREDLSIGEVPSAMAIGLVSPGELSLTEPSIGEVFSDGLSVGELPHHTQHYFDYGRSAGEVSDMSIGMLSSGQVPSSGREEGEMSSSGKEEGEISGERSSAYSEGEAVGFHRDPMGTLGEVSPGEFAQSLGEVSSLSQIISPHSPGSLASSGLVVSGEPEPYLSPPSA